MIDHKLACGDTASLPTYQIPQCQRKGLNNILVALAWKIRCNMKVTRTRSIDGDIIDQLVGTSTCCSLAPYLYAGIKEGRTVINLHQVKEDEMIRH